MPRWVGTLGLSLFGWKVVGQKPVEKKYVIIAAPHTTNWDAPLMLCCAWALGISRVHWMVKDTWYWPPMSWIIRALGGVPVNRRARHNMVDQMVAEFARRERFALLIPPEGTRSYRDYWKSGFYYIALKAGVPIAFGRSNWSTKIGGIEKSIMPTGDVEADMAIIREHFGSTVAKYPEHYGPIRLKPHDESPAPTQQPASGRQA